MRAWFREWGPFLGAIGVPQLLIVTAGVSLWAVLR
jgi:hypothetical protein